MTAAVVLAAIPLAGLTAAPADDAFHGAVDRAVERGRRWLLREYRSPGFRHQGYPMGTGALALYALLKAGHDPGDEFIQDRFSHLAGLEPSKTYSVALYLMALDARHRARAAKRGEADPGPIRGGGRRRMERLLKWLLSAREKGRGVWTYGTGHRGDPDHSNTQFAVLGIEIALRNGLRVPASVLDEIGSNFVKSQVREGEPVALDVTFREAGGGKKRGREPPAEAEPTRPGGWLYRRDPGRWSASLRPTPTLGMTAAGLSSLLVVRNALRKRGAAVPPRVREAIRASMIWITQHYGELNGMRGRNRGIYRDYFYTIYGIEKAGDLGRIVRFGRNDWYRKEAEYLLRAQRGSGRWGTTSGPDSFVHTAFALIFLTRATAATPRRPGEKAPPPPYVVEAPAIKSGTDGERGGDADDRVFVDRLDSFVSARQFFEHLREGRDTEELPVAREILRNWAPDARPELVPHLASLLDGSSDLIASFAWNGLAEITRLTRSGADAYERWYRRWQELREIGLGRDRERLHVALEVVRGKESLPLRETALWALARVREPRVAGDLIGLLAGAPRALRESLHRTLCELSGEHRPFDAARWEGIAAEWREWWARQAGTGKPGVMLSSLLAALESARGPEEAAAALARVVDAGRRAVPPILERMKAPVYSYYLVEALERITGQHLGPAREPWALWWARHGSTAR